MDYNKHQVLYSELDAKRKVLNQKIGELQGTKTWYLSFDLKAAALESLTAKAASDSYIIDLERLESQKIIKSSATERLKNQTSFGWNPMEWFSSERSIAKEALKNTLVEINELDNQIGVLNSKLKINDAVYNRLESNLKRHEKHNSLEHDSKIALIVNEEASLSTKLTEIGKQRDILDSQLSAPLLELKKLVAEGDRVATELSQAESFEDRISNAKNSYEKKQLHELCIKTFGDPSPRKVKATKERELIGINRNVKKLQIRLESIVKRSSRTIGRLVIDGNNMCYLHSQKKFLGLKALRPVADLLSEQYEVLIIFDASIRDQLRKNTEQISNCFSNRVSVHIVSNGEKADESLLKIAINPSDWIISGDRFSDYPEMPAVKNKRLIRHEILEDKVLINDLNFETTY